MPDVAFTALTPLSFLERSAQVYPGKTAIVHGARELSYTDFAAEAARLAGALKASGIQPGDRVAYLCPNIPEMLVAHFGVPLTGAALVAINTRLAPEEVRWICDHSGARILVADTALQPTIEPVAAELRTVREIVSVDDTGVAPQVASTSYAEFLARAGDDDPFPWQVASWTVDDEHRTISINYTSGTTGRPKGVMFTHRGAYLNALGEIVHSRHTPDSVYLWTLPMFHCNGWCTTWAVTGIGGRHVCLRAVRVEAVWDALTSLGVTHLNGAPTVLTMIANAPQARRLDRELVVTTAGAAPSPTIIGQMEDLGARIVHLYGLTETYGPHTVCEWQEAWRGADRSQRARLQARQGVAMLIADPIRVVDERMRDVPRDGQTMGEIVMRGNNVMKGYFLDPEATAEAFRGGWFHSGDLGVWHPDGYIELRDRAKDVIVSGGENISTIEVEQAIVRHLAVLECAVIGVPSERWGERPKAFVVLKPGRQVSEEELIEHVRTLIARYKAPDTIEIVDELPKTSTGKVQKFALREKEWSGQESRIKG
jgi:fatty-acyl-CoA synthase